MEPCVNSNKEAGFTLIEFCVATLITMVGLLGLLQAINMAVEQNLGTMLRNEAISVADEQMVLVKNAALTTAGFDGIASVTTPVLIVRKIRGGNFDYSVFTDVTAMSTQAKEVVIRVSWKYKNRTPDPEHRATSLILSPI